MFHPHWREEALSHLDEGFDLIVVGAGITGCGILLDAAQRGLRVLLVERGDIAAGTSSRSSKLIHGGLRYLRQMQFRITRLSCRERDRMVALNPHLVRPIRFLYAAREGDRVRGWEVNLGLWMYDRLSTLPDKHARLAAEEVQSMAPGLTLDKLDRTIAYTDAVSDDARLTLAVAATGFAYGGLVLTRAAVIKPTTDDGGHIRGVLLRDLESGQTTPVRAHVVINAAGVWVDEIRDAFGLEGSRLRPARGSHIVFSPERLPLKAAVTIASPDDGRPVFLIPHPEGILMGTTDIYHEGSLDDPRVTRDEFGYLLRAVQSHFPACSLTEEDVVGAYAGVRPILHTHSENPSEASREEDIWEERGMLSVAGGKLTTWRQTAEEVVDAALKLLPDERSRGVSPCYTTGTPLASLAPANLEQRLRDAYRLPAGVAEAMARRLGWASWYTPRLAGTKWAARQQRRISWGRLHLRRAEKEVRPLLDGTDLSAAEVRAHLCFGAVVRLEDLLLRRVRIGLWQPRLARELVPYLRPIFQQELGWDRRRWQREAEAFEKALEGWSPQGIQ